MGGSRTVCTDSHLFPKKLLNWSSSVNSFSRNGELRRRTFVCGDSWEFAMIGEVAVQSNERVANSLQRLPLLLQTVHCFYFKGATDQPSCRSPPSNA
ncbi:unnamed protein product [Caenorhabditis auriculariae]|uniref:Uncharacterized protein n=1 Tax=Caenorhabditis auriculariae TaxID=2777116 RepID=A0A8S1GVS6_9PELO|nr:unnamed protein product [Caenorhabditis auriculariae]